MFPLLAPESPYLGPTLGCHLPKKLVYHLEKSRRQE